MAKEPVIQRYNIHVLTKTNMAEGESSTLFKFIELPKLKPCDDSNYCAHLYTNKVSVGLVETQTLVILGEDDQKNIAPISQLSKYYAEAITEGWKLFLFIDTMEQENLRFFTVNSENNEIVWTDRLLIDPMSDIITAQVGFVGDKEGQYENNIYICEIRTTETDAENLTGLEDMNHVGTIKVFSSAIGEDERYRRFFENFGVPDPISYMDVFMDNEDHGDGPNYGKYDDKTDWDLLNQRSKQVFLSYHEIFPYVGTYKALVNAVDLLGYSDIYFKEWYRELTDDASKVRYTTYEIPYKNNRDSKKNIITSLSLEQRVLLKKLNWLTMVYKISEEAYNEYGEQLFEDLPDNVRIPLVQQNYKNYEANEILIKLIALKKWLEKNIIGINCRIIDINGEGLVIERYKYKSFAKTTTGMDFFDEHYLSPYITDDSSLLLQNGKATISIGLKEQYQDDFEKYFYTDAESKSPTYDHFVIRAIMSSKNSALSATKHSDAEGAVAMTTKTLLVQDGEIFFDPKILSMSTTYVGMESSFNILPIIQIEKARLRNPELSWKTSTEYYITNEKVEEDGHTYNYKVTNTRTRNVVRKQDYITLKPSDGATLKYTIDNKLGVPLFILKNFKDYTIPDAIDQDREYIIELLDGKFVFDEEIDGVNRTTYLNMHFDTDSNEQNIEVNYVYSKTVPFSSDILPVKDKEGNIISYPNPLTNIVVNNTGTYKVYVYGMDNYGLIHGKKADVDPVVNIPTPDIELYITNSNSGNESDFFDYNMEGEHASYNKTINLDQPNVIPSINTSFDGIFNGGTACIMREQYLMNDVSVNTKVTGETVIRYATYPTISYSIDTPKENDFAHFMNITDNFKFVGYVSPDRIKDGGYYIQPNTDNTYDFNASTNYALIWLRRNDVFKANTLNDGINRGGSGYKETFNPARLTNIVIYDNIHSEAFYQEMCYMNYDICREEEEYLEYIFLPDDTTNALILYFYNGVANPTYNGIHYELPWEDCIEKADEDTDIRKYTHENPSEDVSAQGEDPSNGIQQFGNDPNSNAFVYTSNAVGMDGGSVNVSDMFKDGKMYKIYAQPAYEIPVANIVTPSDGEKYTTIRFKDGYYPNLSLLFPVGKKVKVSYKVTLNQANELISQNFFTCVEAGLNYIKVDADFKYTFDERTSMYLYEFKETHNESDWANMEEILEEGNYNIIPVDNDIMYQPREINVGEDDPSECYVSESDVSTPRIYVSYAHNAFVDYILTVDHAKELISGYTELYVKDDTLLKYIDDTFSISNRNFDVYNAFEMWMDKNSSTGNAAICEASGDGYDSYYIEVGDNKDMYYYSHYILANDEESTKVWVFSYNGDKLYCVAAYNADGPTETLLDVNFYNNPNMTEHPVGKYTISQDILLYKYTIPVTISTSGNNSHIILSPNMNGMMSNQVFKETEDSYGTRGNGLGVHCRWRLYRYNTKQDKNELMFESWNNALFLTPEELGIYSVELTLFDEYGNSSTVMSEGLFKVKE